MMRGDAGCVSGGWGGDVKKKRKILAQYVCI